MPKTRHQYDIEMLERELQHRKRIEELSATITTTYATISTTVLKAKVDAYILDTFD